MMTGPFAGTKKLTTGFSSVFETPCCSHPSKRQKQSDPAPYQVGCNHGMQLDIVPVPTMTTTPEGIRRHAPDTMQLMT